MHTSPSEIRAHFAQAMSELYRSEVPLYGDLVELVRHINQQVLKQDPTLNQQAEQAGTLQRLSAERHGAIRLGKAEELSTMRRLFSVMGMYPVGYYDLTGAGLPVHSTAFRPVDLAELNANPFRIFTSLLRLELIEDRALREQAESLLNTRSIFTPGVKELIEAHQAQGGLNAQQAEDFIHEALQTFRWHPQATVDQQTYQHFLASHRLIADIVCFRGPHINHLTPRTLDIDQVQQQMPSQGMQPKAIIEGPPQRSQPILLRQTSFKALDEAVDFFDRSGRRRTGTHTARFGEIEQRGMALTPKGRKLYDSLLQKVRDTIPDPAKDVEAYHHLLKQTFLAFPDDLMQLHQQGLAYFRYQPGQEKATSYNADLDRFVENKTIALMPITYEDFLPVSAAGIFHSNLDERETQSIDRSPNQQLFEQQLGCPVISEFELYFQIQRDSLLATLELITENEAYKLEILQQLDERYSA